MFRLPIGASNQTKPDDEILVLTVITEMFNNDEAGQEQEARNNYGKPSDQNFSTYYHEW